MTLRDNAASYEQFIQLETQVSLLLWRFGKGYIVALITHATEFFQQIRKGAIGKYLRKLNLKYTDSKCTI